MILLLVVIWVRNVSLLLKNPERDPTHDPPAALEASPIEGVGVTTTRSAGTSAHGRGQTATDAEDPTQSHPEDDLYTSPTSLSTSTPPHKTTTSHTNTIQMLHSYGSLSDSACNHTFFFNFFNKKIQSFHYLVTKKHKNNRKLIHCSIKRCNQRAGQYRSISYR